MSCQRYGEGKGSAKAWSSTKGAFGSLGDQNGLIKTSLTLDPTSLNLKPFRVKGFCAEQPVVERSTSINNNSNNNNNNKPFQKEPRAPEVLTDLNKLALCLRIPDMYSLVPHHAQGPQARRLTLQLAQLNTTLSIASEAAFKPFPAWQDSESCLDKRSLPRLVGTIRPCEGAQAPFTF